MRRPLRLAAVLLVTVFAVTGLSLWLTELQKGFFDALEKRDATAFGHAIRIADWGSHSAGKRRVSCMLVS